MAIPGRSQSAEGVSGVDGGFHFRVGGGGLHGVHEGENFLDGTKPYLSQESWEKVCSDFAEGKNGSVTLNSNGMMEALCYTPVPYTGWMMAVLIRESIIEEQILGISDINHLTSRQHGTIWDWIGKQLYGNI